MWRESRLSPQKEVIVDGLAHLEAMVAPEVQHVPPLQLLPVFPSVGPGLLLLQLSVRVYVGGGILPGAVEVETWIIWHIIFFVNIMDFFV